MATSPDVRYARSGDVAIAYQVVGDGPVDLVFVPFSDLGVRALKGVPGEWRLDAVRT